MRKQTVARTTASAGRIIMACLMAAALDSAARADTVYLRNGRSIEGFVVEETENGVTVDIGFGRIGLKRSEIDSILKSGQAQSEQLRQKWVEQARQQKIREQEQKIREQEQKLKEEARPRDVVISNEAGGMVVEALLNNKVKARLILDTGATLTTINRNVIERLGINVNAIAEKQLFTLADGSLHESKLFVLHSVSVQGVEARNVQISIMEGKGGSPQMLDGLLGMSFLKNFSFKIDQKRNRLILEKPQ